MSPPVSYFREVFFSTRSFSLLCTRTCIRWRPIAILSCSSRVSCDNCNHSISRTIRLTSSYAARTSENRDDPHEKNAIRSSASTSSTEKLAVAALSGVADRRNTQRGATSFQKAPLVADEGPLSVLYEDEDILVINKPAGLKHEPLHRFVGGSLVNRVVGYLRKEPFIVHRLDMYTSGVVMFGKRREVLRPLVEQFQNNQVSKRYVVLVVGLPPSFFTVDARIGRDSNHKFARTVCADGQSATTHFKLLAANQQSGVSLLEAILVTGRTHQIRVHLQHAGYPVLGDEIYGCVPVLWDGVYGRNLSSTNRLHMKLDKDTSGIVDPHLDHPLQGTHSSCISANNASLGSRSEATLPRNCEFPEEIQGPSLLDKRVLSNQEQGMVVDGENVLPMQRQALHAMLLSLKHPSTGAMMAFVAEIPEDFKAALFACGIQVPDEVLAQ